MPKILVGELNFHYWQMGQGPDVVMIHGMGGNLAVWHLTMIPELQDHYRVTSYDLRGHGRSDVPPSGYTTQQMADDLRGLLDALGIDQAHLVGHCLGADIALHFALRYPRRAAKIVAIEAVLAAMGPVYKRPDWEGWAYITDMLEKTTGIPVPPDKQHDFEYILERGLGLPIIYGPARGRSRSKEQVDRMRTATGIVQTMKDYDFVGDLTLDNLARITSPVLLIYDVDSIFMPSHNVLRERLPNCTSALLPGAGLKHFATLEYPDLILQQIKAFL